MKFLRTNLVLQLSMVCSTDFMKTGVCIFYFFFKSVNTTDLFPVIDITTGTDNTKKPTKA